MVPYVDHPELKFNDKESTQMPFRYVTDKDGKPIMPEVRGAGASPYASARARMKRVSWRC